MRPDAPDVASDASDIASCSFLCAVEAAMLSSDVLGGKGGSPGERQRILHYHQVE